MSASVHALAAKTHTIRACELPPMQHQTLPSFEALNLPYRFLFDTPEADKPELFSVLMVEWNDGLRLYFDKTGASALMYMVEQLSVPATEIIEAIHDDPDGFNNVYRVID